MNVALGLSDGFDLNMGKTSFSDFCKYYPQVDSLESINMIKQEFGLILSLYMSMLVHVQETRMARLI